MIAHILDQLLSKGHTVITTVRSEQKAKPIRDAYKDKGSQLEVVVVGDIAKDGAFDEVVKKPGIEVVLHTASPFHFKWSKSIPANAKNRDTRRPGSYSMRCSNSR